MTMPTAFDPLVDLDGLWTTRLADRYLPLPELPNATYECLDGRLVMTPAEAGTNSWGEMTLGHLIRASATAAGFYVFGAVNLTFNPGRWIQPDVTVLHTFPKTDNEDKWIPATYCTMAVEFVSRESRQQDFVNKPHVCAEGGVPYFMRVELVRGLRHASVDLRKLVDGSYEPLASAISGVKLDVAEPFPMNFDPRELLP